MKTTRVFFLAATVLFSLFFASQTNGQPAGELDPGFGDDGRIPIDTSSISAEHVADMVLLEDGNTVILGTDYSAPGSRLILRRYLPNGRPDESFGSQGKVSVSPGVGESEIAGIHLALQPDGKLIALAWTYGSSGDRNHVLRFLTNGSLDATFGDDGRQQLASSIAAADIAVQDTKIVVGGTMFRQQAPSQLFTVTRLNADGSLDATFGVDGYGVAPFEDVSALRALTVQPDGKIVGQGSTLRAGDTYPAVLVRYNRDGSLDSNFGAAGKVITEYYANSGSAITLQPDGKIVLAGTNGNRGLIARFQPDGSVDRGFGNSGSTERNDIGFRSVGIQADGKIVAGGSTADTQGLARFLENGELDAGFSGGVLSTRFPALRSPGDGCAYGSAGIVTALRIRPNGRIITSGPWFETVLGCPRLQGNIPPGWQYPAIAQYYGDVLPVIKSPTDIDSRNDAVRQGTDTNQPSPGDLLSGRFSSPTITRPFRGQIVGRFASESTEDPTTFRSTAEASGVSTQIGRFSKTTDDLLNILTGHITGTFAMTVADGDFVFGRYTGNVVPATSTFSWLLNATITGGTGRFANATGDFVFIAQGDYYIQNGNIFGNYTESFDGSINY